jgi:acylphosphatase
MTSIKAQRHLISGRVQGVFFRASTREQAIALGLKGYAKNLGDGRVEVIAVGEPSALQILREWLSRGPPAAQVSGVDSTDVEVSGEHVEFRTL